MEAQLSLIADSTVPYRHHQVLIPDVLLVRMKHRHTTPHKDRDRPQCPGSKLPLARRVVLVQPQ